ncbi:MAG TPA: thrombospondin type 3 repeat-containing protein [Candidatus Polarisedimenticolia bacterium]|nr:thrombospondin type 3 repeat-containing protein [Candidatus Polarisedimenticolia bacterium]
MTRSLDAAVRALPAPARIVIVLLVLLLLFVTFPARAEEKKNAWEAGFLYGTSFYANELRLANEAEYGVRFGWYWRPAFEWEIQYRQVGAADLQNENSTLIHDPSVFFVIPGRTFTFTSANYSVRFLINPRNVKRRFKPYAVFGYGMTTFSEDPAFRSGEKGDLTGRLITIGGGVRLRLFPHLALRTEFTTEYEPTQIFHNENLNLGLSWVWGGGGGAGGSSDSDGDGIVDLIDRCPDTPKGALVDTHNGCPWDLDQDGVMEGIDKCAETPRGWPVDETGCPLDTDGDGVPDGSDTCADTPKGAIANIEGCPTDNDGDGVWDGLDKCPDTPKGAVVDPMDSSTAGCPHDSDNDGVFDGVDGCALTPAGATVDDKGCPHDSDGDKVLDGLDQCPDTPKGQKIDKEGCPRIRLDKPEPQIVQNVKFVEGINLWPGTDAWLQLLVDAMQYWSDVTVEVGVYTDNKGSAAANRNISQRRAEVVKGWLVQHGIEAKRIVIKGYGATGFIAENDTEEGRDKNRRVEVKRLSGDLRKHPKPAAEEPAPATETAPPAPEPPATAAPEAPAPSAPVPEPSPAPETPTPEAPAPEPSPAPEQPAPAPTPTPEPPAPEPGPSPSPSPEQPAPGAAPASAFFF